MDIYVGKNKVAEATDDMLWRPPTPTPEGVVLAMATLTIDGSHFWVEPLFCEEGVWYDLTRTPIEETVCSWMYFPEPVDKR